MMQEHAMDATPVHCTLKDKEIPTTLFILYLQLILKSYWKEHQWEYSSLDEFILFFQQTNIVLEKLSAVSIASKLLPLTEVFHHFSWN